MTAHSFVVRESGSNSGRGGRTGRSGAQILEVDRTLLIGVNDFTDHFGTPTSLERDLLALGAAVFAADRAAARGDREDNARTIELEIPVVNLERLGGLQDQIAFVLRRLSSDGWRVSFRQAPGELEVESVPIGPMGKTLLFSGGLDSLAAAIEFGHGDPPLQLVSHKTHNTATSHAQEALAAALTARGLSVVHRSFFVSSRGVPNAGFDHDVENTQRTRSFLFLILGALVARRTGNYEIVYMAENGQMAIHLPLTTARIGSFSTQTAHPAVLQAMERLLKEVLDLPLHIENPYVHRTKKEVVEVIHREMPELIATSTSCWKNARLPTGITHCGECVPCLVRRVAIESLMQDPTAYAAQDLWTDAFWGLPPGDDGRRNMAELAEFAWKFRHLSPADLMDEYPQLRSQGVNAEQAIAMYKRWGEEAARVWGRYPALARLLQ